jgi:hypothetical protein
LKEPFLNPYDLIKILFWPFVIVRILPSRRRTNEIPTISQRNTTTTTNTNNNNSPSTSLSKKKKKKMSRRTMPHHRIMNPTMKTVDCITKIYVTNREIVTAAITNCSGLELQYASVALQQDVEMVKLACANHGRSLEYCPIMSSC